MKTFVISIFVLLTFMVFDNTLIYAQEEEILEEEEIIEEQQQPKKEVKQKKEGEGETLEESVNTEIEDEGNLKKSWKELYYKKKYEKTFDYPFEVVWEAIKKSLTDKNCQVGYERYTQTDEGLYKGTIKSDYCVFTAGDDTTFATLKKYSLEVPFIRGGIWLNGRMEYKFKLRENDDGSVYVRLKGQISGFEDFVTHEVHFWESNGYLETKMLEAIEKNCKILNE